MLGLKYEICDEDPVSKLFRIKALKDIPGTNVKAGDIGGQVASPSSLTQEGNCWVYKDAVVKGSSHVYGNAIINGYALLEGNVHVAGNVLITGKAHLLDNVHVAGNACIFGSVVVAGNAKIKGDIFLMGDVCIRDNARISGGLVIGGFTTIGGSAYIQTEDDWLTIGPVGGTYYTLFRSRELGQPIPNTYRYFAECSYYSTTISLERFTEQLEVPDEPTVRIQQLRAAVELFKVTASTWQI